MSSSIEFHFCFGRNQFSCPFNTSSVSCSQLNSKYNIYKYTFRLCQVPFNKNNCTEPTPVQFNTAVTNKVTNAGRD